VASRSFAAKDAKDAKDCSRSLLSMDIQSVSGEVVDSAIKVHSVLGPGLMENVYKTCLAFELRKRGLEVQTEVPCPVIYEGLKIDGGYRIDLIVERCVVVELKAVDRILEVHDAQLLSYLRLSGHKLGLRINFNVVHLKDGIKRMVNGF
jgi:GxxExxY protein